MSLVREEVDGFGREESTIYQLEMEFDKYSFAPKSSIWTSTINLTLTHKRKMYIVHFCWN